jgi:RNA polymerase sigma-70 factor, ECF subfamily
MVNCVSATETHISDNQLALRSAQGRTQAFEELYQRHNLRVYSLCLKMTANVADAEDLSQEVFVQLIRKLGSFRGESAFTSWLHRLTVNQVLMHYRKRRARPREAGDDYLVHAEVGSRVSQPTQLSVMDRLFLDRAIRTLPTGKRAVLLLHDLEGYGHPQIADILGCSVGTSKSQLHKARRILRRRLLETT